MVTATNNAALVDQLSRMDGARLRAYRDNLAFYHGQQWAVAQRRRERRLVFNYAKAMIDKTASYLMSSVGFVVDVVDSSEAAQTRARAAETALRDVYEANNLAQLDFDNEIDTSILGDGAYKLTWDALERRVRISAPDVQGLFAWWVGDDVSCLWRVASRYYLTDEEAALLYPAAQTAAARSGATARKPAAPGRQHTGSSCGRTRRSSSGSMAR
jgi:hypothetical protein